MGLLIPGSVWERYRDRNILLMSAIIENSGHKSGSNCSDHDDWFGGISDDTGGQLQRLVTVIKSN